MKSSIFQKIGTHYPKLDAHASVAPGLYSFSSSSAQRTHPTP